MIERFALLRNGLSTNVIRFNARERRIGYDFISLLVSHNSTTVMGYTDVSLM